MIPSSKVYFPNLNTIRAFAAIIVIISHIELRKGLLGENGGQRLFQHWGSFGVLLFFVLSGFLITYLLLREKHKINTIDVKSFYIRRALRIWPLYFLILFFTYLLIPYLLPEYYESNMDRFSLRSFLLNVFMLTNITLVIKLTPLMISTIWSIGIEEQFYLFWPWVVKLQEKTYLKIILFITLIIPFGKLFFMALISIWNISIFKIISEVISTTRFDCMAIGAFFGILAYRKEIKLSKFSFTYGFFTTNKIQYLAYSLLALFFTISFFLPSKIIQIFNFMIFPILFGICILNLATNHNSILRLENKFTNYIGKISYGLYLNHMVIIYLFFPVLKPILGESSEFIQNLVLYPLTLMIVFIISHISYNFYEHKFIGLKKKYAHVKT